MARINQYPSDQNYTPHLYLDGSIDAGSGTGSWATRITSELAVSAPMDIQISGIYSTVSRAGHAHIRIIATAPITNTSLKVRIGIIESNINRSSPNGTTIHNQTFRDMTPNTTGIALTIAQGDTVNLTQSFNCPSPLVSANCDLVVFVQSDQSSANHKILQGAKKRVTTMTYALDPFVLISPPDGDTIGSCSPNLIWHHTIDSDSAYAVHYQASLSMDSTFENILVSSDTLSDTTWTPQLCLPNNMTYYWKVTALNDHAPNRECTTPFSFTIVEESHLTPFSLISPPNLDSVEICSPPLVWQRSIDADSGYAVRYQVLLNQTPDFETPFLYSDTLSDTTWTPPLCLPNHTTFYWKVEAFTGHAQGRPSTQIFGFYVNEPPVGCTYVVGDANGSNSFTGLDITYSVRYFKGGPAPTYICECPPGSGNAWYVSGDVNGSCSFSGLDVTYMVRYFKGGPGPIPCPNCPPVHR